MKSSCCSVSQVDHGEGANRFEQSIDDRGIETAHEGTNTLDHGIEFATPGSPEQDVDANPRLRLRSVPTQTTIDRGAMEKLRAEQIALADSVSKRIVQALDWARRIVADSHAMHQEIDALKRGLSGHLRIANRTTDVAAGGALPRHRRCLVREGTPAARRSVSAGSLKTSAMSFGPTPARQIRNRWAWRSNPSFKSRFASESQFRLSTW